MLREYLIKRKARAKPNGNIKSGLAKEIRNALGEVSKQTSK